MSNDLAATIDSAKVYSLKELMEKLGIKDIRTMRKTLVGLDVWLAEVGKTEQDMQISGLSWKMAVERSSRPASQVWPDVADQLKKG